jgi:hypothetical protein
MDETLGCQMSVNVDTPHVCLPRGFPCAHGFIRCIPEWIVAEVSAAGQPCVGGILRRVAGRVNLWSGEGGDLFEADTNGTLTPVSGEGEEVGKDVPHTVLIIQFPVRDTVPPAL